MIFFLALFDCVKSTGIIRFMFQCDSIFGFAICVCVCEHVKCIIKKRINEREREKEGREQKKPNTEALSDESDNADALKWENLLGIGTLSVVRKFGILNTITFVPPQNFDLACFDYRHHLFELND